MRTKVQTEDHGPEPSQKPEARSQKPEARSQKPPLLPNLIPPFASLREEALHSLFAARHERA